MTGSKKSSDNTNFRSSTQKNKKKLLKICDNENPFHVLQLNINRKTYVNKRQNQMNICMRFCNHFAFCLWLQVGEFLNLFLFLGIQFTERQQQQQQNVKNRNQKKKKWHKYNELWERNGKAKCPVIIKNTQSIIIHRKQTLFRS